MLLLKIPINTSRTCTAIKWYHKQNSLQNLHTLIKVDKCRHKCVRHFTSIPLILQSRLDPRPAILLRHLRRPRDRIQSAPAFPLLRVKFTPVFLAHFFDWNKFLHIILIFKLKVYKKSNKSSNILDFGAGFFFILLVFSIKLLQTTHFRCLQEFLNTNQFFDGIKLFTKFDTLDASIDISS